jgi:hypothetical protein
MKNDFYPYRVLWVFWTQQTKNVALSVRRTIFSIKALVQM